MKILEETPLEYPCKVQIGCCHNNEIDTLQADSFKDLAEDVIDTIRQYFRTGMTPGIAYRDFVSNLSLTHNNNLLEYLKALADRSLCPRRRHFNKLRGDFNLEKYGGSNSNTMFKVLADRITRAKAEFAGTTSQYSLHDKGNPLILELVTPMMHRIRQHVQEAGVMVVIDSSNMEEFNLRVF